MLLAAAGFVQLSETDQKSYRKLRVLYSPGWFRDFGYMSPDRNSPMNMVQTARLMTSTTAKAWFSVLK